jgi:hypothetical protein
MVKDSPCTNGSTSEASNRRSADRGHPRRPKPPTGVLRKEIHVLSSLPTSIAVTAGETAIVRTYFYDLLQDALKSANDN